jgi:hypothetical protein
MKKLIIKMGLFGAMILAAVQLSYATSVSSQPVHPAIGFVGSPFLIQANESISYIVASTGAPAGVAMSTVAFQYSSNNQNWHTEVTTAPTAVVGKWSVTGELPIKLSKTYYRFKILGSSGNATVITMYDNDNEVMVVKNNKDVDTLILNDESLQLKGIMKADKYNYVADPSTSAIIITTHTTQLVWGREAPIDKRATGYTTPTYANIKNSYSILTATGSVEFSQTLTARPIISTETAQNGDILTFEMKFGTAVLTSGTNTGLILGAATRDIGPSDIIQLIYRDGAWREMFYTNNTP